MSHQDKVIELSLQHFDKLKRTLKPGPNEFSSFSSIVCRRTLPNGEDDYQLISLALGTRSIAGERAKLNNLIIDMHAESVNRRAFKYYLAKRAVQNLDALKEDLEKTDFHLLISQLPCGIVNRYRGSDNSIRKKPGRGEVSKKATCFDKLLKWTLLGLQGRKLFSILSKPIRFKSIIIGNCSLEMVDQDKETFRQGFNLETSSEIRTGASSDQPGEQKPQHEQSDASEHAESKTAKTAVGAETDEGEEPKRKRLKASKQSAEAERCDDTVEKELVKKTSDSEMRCDETESASTDHPSSSLFEPIKPEIYFSETFVNELFIRNAGKRPQDKSVVYFLEPKEAEAESEPKAELKEPKAKSEARPKAEPETEPEAKKEAKEEAAPDNPPEDDGKSSTRTTIDTQPGSDAVQEVPGAAEEARKDPETSKDQETSKVTSANAERATKGPVSKPKRKDEYRLECIQDGRKLGSTKQNYERLLLTLSPSSLDRLISNALEKATVDLKKSESVAAYDSTWNRLKKQHPNFLRWL